MSYAKDRDKAFIEAVVNDNWDAIKKHSKKYGLTIPQDERVMKAGIYKAVQYCTKIPDKVKTTAMLKCLKMGFSPFIKPENYDKED